MNNKEVVTLKIAELVPFAGHPFKLLSAERLSDMAESIKANGIISPIICRPIDDGRYEILSGHNRVEAAKIAEFTEVPAVVREGLTDDEAMFIVTETNLLQRSFSEMNEAEKASVISGHYKALKSQGRRADLIDDVNEYVNSGFSYKGFTSGKFARSSTARDEMAKIFGLSSRTVGEYIRADCLIAPLKKHFEEGEFVVSVAALLSFLGIPAQTIVENELAKGGRINNQKANSLRYMATNDKFDAESAAKVIHAERKHSTAKLALNKKSFVDLMQEGQTEEDLAEEMRAALAYYRKRNKNH